MDTCRLSSILNIWSEIRDTHISLERFWSNCILWGACDDDSEKRIIRKIISAATQASTIQCTLDEC